MCCPVAHMVTYGPITTEAAYQTILTILGNQHFNNLQMETAWKLIETSIQPIITYGGESWKLNKKENKMINQIQENIIRRILMHGTTIYSNWTLIYRVGAAGHHNDNNQKQNKRGKATTQTTQQHDNESNE